MRKLSNFFNRFNLADGVAVDKFPNHLLVYNWILNSLVFRFMLDPVNGNDNNDGLTWETAKKTMDGVLSALPTDLQGYEVYVLCAGGTTYWRKIQKSNGKILLRWCGSFMNSINNSFTTWAKNGSSKTFTDDACTFLTQQISFHFCSDLVFLTSCYSESGGQAWGKLVIEEDPANPTINIGDGLFWFNGYRMTYDIIHLKFKIRTCDYFGIGINTVSNSAINIYSIDCEVLSGSNLITRSGQWGGFFVMLGECSRHASINIGTYGMSYDANFPAPGGKNINLTNCKQLFTTQTSMATNLWLDVTSINFTAGTSGVTKPLIYISSTFYGGRIVYNSNLLDLTDACSNPKLIYDTYTSTYQQKLNDNLRFFKNDPILKLDTSAVADADLANSELTFYLDETNNKLMFKLKYLNGTLKSGEIALT